MSRNLELEYSFGYVFDKSKLVVMYPMGSNIMSEDEYEIEVEVAFLEDGVESAFEEGDIKEANDFIKPLEPLLTKVNKVIPLVTSIKDADTKEELNKLLTDFNEEYEIVDKYEEKGYEFKDVYYVFENVVKYIPKENLDNLNILKVNKEEIKLEELIKTTQENLDEEVDSKLIPINIVQNPLTGRLFTKKDEKTNISYIPFAVMKSSSQDEILCANKEVLVDCDLDKGDLELNTSRDIGYIVEEKDNEVTIKIGNFNSDTPNKTQIVQVLDYAGVFKSKMINFLNEFLVK